jgi:hypothetical protein
MAFLDKLPEFTPMQPKTEPVNTTKASFNHESIRLAKAGPPGKSLGG